MSSHWCHMPAATSPAPFASGGKPGEPAESYEAITDEQIAERLILINDYALGAVGGGSLAGYQPKTRLALLDGVWHAGIDGAASTHIIKPVAAGNEHALHAEAYCLDLSRRIGLTTFASDVRTFAGRRVERIHQEDGAQALGLPWDTDSKFEGVNAAANLKNLAKLLRRRRDILGSGPDDRETLLAHTAFNTAVGNTDAHAKNFSTLRSPAGAVRLAPLYDVSMHALAPNGQLKMSLQINSRAFQPSLTVEDLVAEGISWGLDGRHARHAVTERSRIWPKPSNRPTHPPSGKMWRGTSATGQGIYWTARPPGSVAHTRHWSHSVQFRPCHRAVLLGCVRQRDARIPSASSQQTS